LDGQSKSHDAQRPYRNGGGSFDVIMRNVEPLLAGQSRMQVSARVTVTPRNLDLCSTLDAFIDAGFHSVGFSPMRASPYGQGEMQPDDLEIMLEQMIACGREF
ncbi:radical SAM protein, partial [Elizabethkingia argentiflava]|nr:radical SAM protein [Elizabethkingia argenteiflava]